MLARLVALALLLLVLATAALAARTEQGAGAAAARPLAGWTERGRASWYGGFFHGRLTASGVRYDQHAPMAAHRTLPFGTLVRVTNLTNGQATWVVIRDRGPFIPGRVIDLSRHSAEQLDMVRPGTAPVRLEVVK